MYNKLTLKRRSSMRKSIEPPSIQELINNYSTYNSDQSVTELELMALMKFHDSSKGFIVRFHRTPDSAKVLFCSGLEEGIEKRLMRVNKGSSNKTGLIKWLMYVYEKLDHSSPFLESEPSTTIPDVLAFVKNIISYRISETVALILLNPLQVDVKNLMLLEDFLAVCDQLFKEEQLHRSALNSLVNLGRVLDNQNEGLIYVSFRSYTIKQISKSALNLIADGEDETQIMGRRLWHIFDKQKDSIKKLLQEIAKIQPESPPIAGAIENDDTKKWRLKTKDKELLLSFPGKATLKRSPCAVILIRDADSYEIRVRQAEAKSKSKTDFMAHLGHEIRTPLNCILSILPLLVNSSLSEEQKKYIQIIQQSSFDMMVMVGDFLDLARLDNQRMTLHESELALDELIELIYRNLKPSADTKYIDFIKKIDSTIPAKIFADHNRLRQVIQNLVNNAIKFTKRGTVSLDVSSHQHKDYHRIKISVQDTGIGISEENLKLIFKSFRQVDESTTQQQGGIGLGLSISKKLMKLMDHGSIKVTSEPGVGSTFTIEFNSPILDNELLLRRHKDLIHEKKVLIVDDTANNRIMLFDQLEQWGMRPSVSASAEDAMNISLASKGGFTEDPFDLAIVDLRMPTMDGVGLANWIRRQGFSFPMILLSSSPEESDNLSAEEKAKFKFCLVRPIPQRKLLATILATMGSQDKTLELIMNPSPVNHVVASTGRTSMVNQDKQKRVVRVPSELKATRILVAEDTNLNQRVIESLLRRLGYQNIRMANNGNEVIELSQQPNTHFDIILMDIRMPIMNGFQASKTITNEYSQRRLPRPKILAITAMGTTSEELIDWSQKGYIDDVIAKPIELSLLKDKIEKLLINQDRSRRQSTPM